ncbi:MAG: hypothetical protein ABIR81_04390 [Ginsengibacter sp.]
MTLKHYITLATIIGIAGCTPGNRTSPTLDDPMSSGREFIESSLKGDYASARKHLLQDSLNIEYFNGLQNFNEKMNGKDKLGYKDANIIIDSISKLSDTISIIHYSNTFKNKPDKIKMLKVDNNWLVDFKYTFQ